MASGVKDVDLGYDSFVKGLETMDGHQVSAGIYNNPELALRAIVNEFGSPSKNIPARPAWQAAMDANREEYFDIAEKALEAAITGSGPIQGRQVLEQLGKRMAKDIQASVRGWTSPPNADATIEGPTGKGISDPLVDTGETVESITHKVGRAIDGGF